MTHLRLRLQNEPTAAPVTGVPVRIVSARDGTPLATPSSDALGFVEWLVNGNPGPALFGIAAAGAPKYWDPREAGGVGAVALPEIPPMLTRQDGVVAGYRQALEVQDGPEGVLVVAPGAAILGGIPLVFRDATPLAYPRPAVDERIDRVVVRVITDETDPLETGFGDIVRWPGAEGGFGPPEIPGTPVGRTISLAWVAIPPVGPLTIVDERPWAGDVAEASIQAHSAEASTVSAVGESLPFLSTVIALPRRAAYEIVATVTAQQVDYHLGTGALALDIGGAVSAYITGGAWDSEIANAAVRQLTGPGQVAMGVYGKAVSGTASWEHLVLDVRAIPRG
jgi:hypothetical protein